MQLLISVYLIILLSRVNALTCALLYFFIFLVTAPVDVVGGLNVSRFHKRLQPFVILLLSKVMSSDIIEYSTGHRADMGQ